MAYTEWIKVVRIGSRSRGKRQGSDSSRWPTKPVPLPQQVAGQSDLSPPSGAKIRSSSSSDRRITGAGFTSVMPKDKFQPAFSKALRARVAFLKRRLSSAEMKNLARSVRRGWTPPKKSLPSKGRKPGLGYIPSQKPKYSDVLKGAKVPTPPPPLRRGIEFVKGKTLVGSDPPVVAKAPVAKSHSEAKEEIMRQVSVGAKYVASLQERTEKQRLATAKLSLLANLRRVNTSAERVAFLRNFALVWGAKELDTFTNCVRVYLGGSGVRRSVVRYNVDYGALGRVGKDAAEAFELNGHMKIREGGASDGIELWSRERIALVRAQLDDSGWEPSCEYTTKKHWSLGAIVTSG